MTRTTLLSALLSLALVPACQVGDVTGPGAGGGGGGGGGGDGSGDGDGSGGGGGGGSGDEDIEPGAPDAAPEPEDFALILDGETTADLNLGEQVEFVLTLSSDNFEGPVTLSATGAPESWEVAFSPSDVVDLGLDEFFEVTVTVTIPTNGEPGTHPLAISASAEPGLREGQLSVNAANTVLLPVSDGTGNGQHDWPELLINQGTLVRFVNRDTGTSHRIHAGDGGAGFDHQDDDMAAAPAPGQDGGNYDVTITQGGQYQYYCHNHDPGSGVGTIGVTAP